VNDLPPFLLPARVARELGFSEVLQILASCCTTPFGREDLEREIFPPTRDGVSARLEEVMEAAVLAGRRSTPDFVAVRDVRLALELVEKEAVLGPADLIDVARTTDAIARVRDLLESRAEELPRLAGRAMALCDERDWARRVLRSFDEAGQLHDDASPALKELRARVRHLRTEAQAQLEDLIRAYDAKDLLRERNFTVRNDRYVLPVRAELQSRVEGIVHDASQTGLTVFIEPREILELGNRIKIARAAAMEEEQRILAELTEQVRERADALRADLLRVGAIEALFARGLFAAKTGARAVTLDDKGRVELKTARHPLLAWAYAVALKLDDEAKPGEVVPNDIGFSNKRALIITGPNAGGKTVALKTLGLCAILVRSGMPVPVAADSHLPLFTAVLSTIGDQQSLADALSSFSGHLEALRGILDVAPRQAREGPVLCLLDELASGTDPAQGAAIGQAVLEALVDAGALTVATTHFERLKLLALEERADNPFRNASLALDPASGRPTFTLRLDQVGTSNALEAARRHRLPDAVIARAEALLAPEEKTFQDLIGGLAGKQATLERRIEEVEGERARLEQERHRLSERLDDVEREAERLRREGAKAFLDELEGARKVVAEAIERTKAGADARELNRLSHELRAHEERAERAAQAPRERDTARGLAGVKKGDLVEVVTMPGTPMEVVEVHGEEVVVARGPMRLRTDLGSLRRAKGPPAKEAKAAKKAAALALAEPRSEPRTADNTLDLRGERVDDGVELLEAFLDRLLRDGKSRGFVLHGHGTGAMKRAVREALANSRYISRSGPADADDGGDSCSAFELADARA
jgi:DNA mismatch repair protein MutS2